MLFTVLMTATINPGEYSGDISRNNIDTRISDYQQAIYFWRLLGDKRIKSIVFCENSGFNLDCFREFNESSSHIPIEFISLDDNKKKIGMHYGFNELGIMDFALQNSVLLNDSQYFIKSTGRLQFPKIVKLLNSLPDDFDAIVDHRRSYRREAGDSRARTQLMFFKTKYYLANLLNTRNQMIGRMSHIEEFLPEKFDQSEAEGKNIYRRFKIECPTVGFTGTNGQRYNSINSQAKTFIRGVVRGVAPKIWL